MDAVETRTGHREEIELLREQVHRDRILLAAQDARLLFLPLCDHPYPGKIWTEGLPDFAYLESAGVAAHWSKPLGDSLGRMLCRTEDGAEFVPYDWYSRGNDRAKQGFEQIVSVAAALLVPDADSPRELEFLKQLFEFSRSHKLLKWEVNEQPGHPETRRRIAWLHDVYATVVLLLNAKLESLLPANLNTGQRDDDDEPPRQKSKRGRPPKYDWRNDRKLAKAWVSGQYNNSVEKLGKAFGLSKGEAQAALDRDRKRYRSPLNRKALAAKNRDQLFIGGTVDKASETVTLWRGNLDSLAVPFSAFPPSGDGIAPDFDDFAVTDGGQTVRFGKYEAAADAILYEYDAEYRRQKSKERLASERTLGASIRRLRKQRGLRREDFAPLAAKTLARIEQGRVKSHHAKTLATIAKVLGVKPDELETY